MAHKHLHERMDALFSNGQLWQHRTLRTLFDPGSAEWESTTPEKKIEMLRRILESGESLRMIGLEYKEYYTEDLNKAYVSQNYEHGLESLLAHVLGTPVAEQP